MILQASRLENLAEVGKRALNFFEEYLYFTIFINFFFTDTSIFNEKSLRGKNEIRMND